VLEHDSQVHLCVVAGVDPCFHLQLEWLLVRVPSELDYIFSILQSVDGLGTVIVVFFCLLDSACNPIMAGGRLEHR